MTSFANTTFMRWFREKICGHPPQTKEPVVPPQLPVEVRKASHDLNNQSMILRHSLRKIADSDDPVAALVSAMRNAYNDPHPRKREP